MAVIGDSDIGVTLIEYGIVMSMLILIDEKARKNVFIVNMEQ